MTDRKEATPYARFDYGGATREQILRASDETFEKWKAEATAVDEANEKEAVSRWNAIRDLRAILPAIHPRGSEEYRKLSKAVEKHAPASRFSHLDQVKSLHAEAIKAREKLSREKANTAEEARLLLAAGAYLAARGKVVGKDYEAHEAVDLANEIAKDEAIAIKVAEGGLTGFGGDDYCEGCDGWDMMSPRCECQNCRVGWESEGNFESMTVYAQAH